MPYRLDFFLDFSLSRHFKTAQLFVFSINFLFKIRNAPSQFINCRFFQKNFPPMWNSMMDYFPLTNQWNNNCSWHIVQETVKQGL